MGAILLLAALPLMASDYPAPSGSATAKIIATPVSCESVVEIATGSALLGRQSYVSADHESGSCVAHAAWTPDSKFFVFSLQDSGGHQPWNSPIIAFSVEKRQFLDIDVGDSEAITDPDFALAAPDLIEFETTTIPLDANQPVRRHLKLGSIQAKPMGH